MAAAHPAQRHYDYGYAPGPSVGAMNSPMRSPSPSSRNQSNYNHPYARQYDDGHSNHDYNQYNRHQRDSDIIPPPPDLRVTAPSRAGEERDGEEMDDDRSVYSERMSTMTAPQNFYSSVFQSGAPSSSASSHHLSAFSSRSDASRESWQTESAGSTRPDSNIDPFSFMQYETPRATLPKVVVSSPSEGSFRNGGSYSVSNSDSTAIVPEPITPPPNRSHQGRVPSAVQGTRNFSRPSRPPAGPAPLPPKSSEDQKREVIERNQHRRMGPISPSGSMNSLGSSPSAPLRPQRSQENLYSGIEDSDDIGSEYMTPGRRSRSASPSATSPQGPIPALSQSSSSSSNSSHQQSPRTPQKQQGPVTLPSNPPDLRVRAGDTESVYSMYSYYQLDSASPSPSSPNFDHQGKATREEIRQPASVNMTSPKPQGSPSAGKSSHQPSPNSLPTNPTTADDFLALGIEHHEANRLTESAQCFEKSATLNGGHAVGMLMWGLTLRHGWGVPRDEPRAFKWLKRAAEHAVVDLQHGRTKSGRDAIKVSC